MFMYAETSVHVGGGESVGTIDLAIAREKYTDFPFIPSSGVKGALRAWFEAHGGKENPTYGPGKISQLFGSAAGEGDSEEGVSDHAGALVFTDARILLFPVRTLKGVFAWITCPMVLERLKRDMAMAGRSSDLEIPKVAAGTIIAPEDSECVLDGNQAVLEEYTFKVEKKNLSGLTDFLAKAFPSSKEYEYWRDKLPTNLLLLSDDDFKDFAKTSTEIQTRIKIDSETKTVAQGALFYQENLPADSLMYAVTAAQEMRGMKSDEVMNTVHALKGQRVQLGGDESVGKGIYCINFQNGEG
ncbi:MAG: type III-B CRISPR module RAMP protein Cmr4 [Cyclonatronaceae bacterium]